MELCEYRCPCCVPFLKFLTVFFCSRLYGHLGSGKHLKKRKKINSASLLIKGAWSLWQNAMREKQQLTLGFWRGRWSWERRGKTILHRSLGASEKHRKTHTHRETFSYCWRRLNTQLLTPPAYGSWTVLFICSYIILPSPLIWKVISLWGVV